MVTVDRRGDSESQCAVHLPQLTIFSGLSMCMLFFVACIGLQFDYALIGFHCVLLLVLTVSFGTFWWVNLAMENPQMVHLSMSLVALGIMSRLQYFMKDTPNWEMLLNCGWLQVECGQSQWEARAIMDSMAPWLPGSLHSAGPFFDMQTWQQEFKHGRNSAFSRSICQSSILQSHTQHFGRAAEMCSMSCMSSDTPCK